MQHRHLNHQSFSLAAIDNIIASGQWKDWSDLRQEVLSSPVVMEKVKRVCQPYLNEPFAQRYHFWNNYVKEHQRSS